MSSSAFGTILVGVDFTELGGVALASAAEWARAYGSARLHLVHAVRPWSWPGPLALDDGVALAYKRLLELAAEDLERLQVPATEARVTREVVGGTPAQVLIEVAERVQADLLVVATHQRGPLARAVVGSVAAHAIRAAPCPVLVTGSDRPLHGSPRRVIAAIDLDDVSDRVLELAHGVVRETGGALTVVSAYDLDRGLAARRELHLDELRPLIERLPRIYRVAIVERIERVLGPSSGARVEVVAEDPPAKLILETAESERAELIVLGTSSHGALARLLLGSTASRVIAEARCPVLVASRRPEPAPVG